MKEALEVLYDGDYITLRSVGFNPEHVVSYEYAESLSPEQAKQVGTTLTEVVCVDFVNGQTKYLLGGPTHLFGAKAKKTILKS